MPRRNYHNSTSFLDLLFNTLLGFVLLFFISSLMMNPIAKKGDIDTKAEFVITVTWEDENDDDVDTWLRDPLGNVVYFRQKEAGLTHLDRDDLGKLNDRITLEDGTTYEYPHNQEITSIRGFIGGEWVLNVHMYSKRSPEPTKVEVRIDRLNPVVKTIFHREIFMERQWEEITVSRFVMTDHGEILSWDDLPKKLVSSWMVPPRDL